MYENLNTNKFNSSFYLNLTIDLFSYNNMNNNKSHGIYSVSVLLEFILSKHQHIFLPGFISAKKKFGPEILLFTFQKFLNKMDLENRSRSI